MPFTYDFLWDDQGDNGAWVLPNDAEKHGTDLVLVEAMVRELNDEDNFGEFCGYSLASDITLEPGDSVWVSSCPDALYGAAAQAALDKLVEIERKSRQVAMTEEQERDLGPNVLVLDRETGTPVSRT